MNNLTLAGDDWTYYETIGGGQGACPDADGPSAIHVAMSNTLNTPVEALETEYPLRVRELALRRGSGGDGRRRGGDGIVREIEALEPMRFTLITERRRHAPRGRDGGADGAPGRNLLNGEELAAKCAGELAPGDRLRIETPGGGGHGRALTAGGGRRGAGGSNIAHKLGNFGRRSLDWLLSTGPERPLGATSKPGPRFTNSPLNQPTYAYCL